MTRHVLFLSGGIGSYITGKRLKQQGITPDLLFTDTLIEDDDLYRFLIEVSCDLLEVNRSDDQVTNLIKRCESIPPIQDGDNRGRYLMQLGYDANKLIPKLHWIADGRTPWEVFKDYRLIGNTRTAKCSHVLKQAKARKWLERYCHVYRTIIYLGIGADEAERFTGTKDKKGAKELWFPWECKSPLCDPPFIGQKEKLEILASNNIRIPRLYEQGFSHNNCGGFCVRAGHSQFLQLLHHYPDRYEHHAEKEEEMRRYLAKDVSILRDMRFGHTKPRTLYQLRMERGTDEQQDFRGCGCFTSEEE